MWHLDCSFREEARARALCSMSWSTADRPATGGWKSAILAVTRYFHHQYCVVYSIQMGSRKGSLILCNNREIVLHQGEQCRWAGGMKGWLIRAQYPRSKRISCKGQRGALRAGLRPAAGRAPS